MASESAAVPLPLTGNAPVTGIYSTGANATIGSTWYDSSGVSHSTHMDGTVPASWLRMPSTLLVPLALLVISPVFLPIFRPLRRHYKSASPSFSDTAHV